VTWCRRHSIRHRLRDEAAKPLRSSVAKSLAISFAVLAFIAV
jgi:hypothetical protein